jgi:cupin 2 domain-containing protein
MKNIFSSIPDTIDDEVFDDLLKRDSIRIERILSKGQRSPDDYWYDQDENDLIKVQTEIRMVPNIALQGSNGF